MNKKERVKMERKEISKAVISRLPRYYRYLGELIEEGVERISSNELSSRMKVTASQIIRRNTLYSLTILVALASRATDIT